MPILNDNLAKYFQIELFKIIILTSVFKLKKLFSQELFEPIV